MHDYSTFRGADEKLEKMLNLLTCLDIRLDKDKIAYALGVTKRAVQHYHAKLREMHAKKEIVAAHMRDIRALGLTSVVAVATGGFLKDVLEAEKIVELERKYPRLGYLVRFIGYAAKFGSGLSLLALRVPSKHLWEVMEAYEKAGAVKDYWPATLVPVQRCHESGARLAEAFYRLRGNPSYKPRDLLIDSIIMTILDVNPLAYLVPDDFNVEVAYKYRVELRSLVGAIAYRYLRRHYTALSRAGVAGRVAVLPRKPLSYVWIFADGDLDLELYTFAARKAYGLYVTVTEGGFVFADVYTGLENLRTSLQSYVASGRAQIDTVLAATSFAFPFEMIDPRENTWALEPVAPKVLPRYRILEAAAEGGGQLEEEDEVDVEVELEEG
ncbi:MAG: hypothetical protein ABWW70_04710 [Thermoproteota archaeon]